MTPLYRQPGGAERMWRGLSVDFHEQLYAHRRRLSLRWPEREVRRVMAGLL